MVLVSLARFDNWVQSPVYGSFRPGYFEIFKISTSVDPRLVLSTIHANTGTVTVNSSDPLISDFSSPKLAALSSESNQKALLEDISCF